MELETHPLATVIVITDAKTNEWSEFEERTIAGPERCIRTSHHETFNYKGEQLQLDCERINAASP